MALYRCKVPDNNGCRIQDCLCIHINRHKHTHTHARTYTPCTEAPQRPARSTVEHMPILMHTQKQAQTHSHTHARTYTPCTEAPQPAYANSYAYTLTSTNTHTLTHTPCTVAPQRPARGTAEHMPYLWARAAASPKAHPNCPAAYARGLRRLLALFVDLQTLCSWEDVERRTGGSAGPSASPGMCKREG